MADSSGVFVGWSSGLLRSTDHGETFASIAPHIRLVGGAPNDLFGFHDTLGLLRSRNGGTQWEECGFRPAMYPRCVAASGDTIIIGYNGAYVSTNGGVSWTYTLATKGGTYYPPVYTAAVCEGVIFAGSDYVYRSTDNGANWIQTAAGGARHASYALCVVGKTVYAGTYAGVWRSSDLGVSWEHTSDGLPSPSTIGIMRLAALPGGLIAGSDASGLYTTALDPIAWRSMGHGMTGATPDNVASDEAYAYATIKPWGSQGVSYGGGLWRRPMNEFTAVEGAPALPQHVSLSQNFPNPFNPTTRFLVTIGGRDHVTVRVFDLLGRQVATLMDMVKEPGAYELEFEGASLPSGMYLCRLQAGTTTETRKIVLLK